MPKFANQQTVRIDKPEKQETNFALYGKDDLADACTVLNPSALRVYLYLLSNAPQVSWDISPQHANDKWGIAINSFKDGLNELKNKGYYDPVNRVIHQKAQKPIDEIRRKRRNSTKNETRDDGLNFDSMPDEIHMSNNINTENIKSENTVDADASTNNIGVTVCASATPSAQPEVEVIRVSTQYLDEQARRAPKRRTSIKY